MTYLQKKLDQSHNWFSADDLCRFIFRLMRRSEVFHVCCYKKILLFMILALKVLFYFQRCLQSHQLFFFLQTLLKINFLKFMLKVNDF